MSSERAGSRCRPAGRRAPRPDKGAKLFERSEFFAPPVAESAGRGSQGGPAAIFLFLFLGQQKKKAPRRGERPLVVRIWTNSMFLNYLLDFWIASLRSQRQKWHGRSGRPPLQGISRNGGV